MRRRIIVVRPATLALVIAVGVFGTLLAITGWTWPLEIVAVLLPVAGLSLFA